MPDRILRASILTSDRVNTLSWPGEVFYRRLMSVADDYGRYDGRIAVLRAQLFPLKLDRVTEPDIGKWIGECQEAGLVRVYAVEGKQYIEIQRFNQRTRTPSRWPDPPQDGSCGHLLSNGSKSPPMSYSDAKADSDIVVVGGGVVGAPASVEIPDRHQSIAQTMTSGIAEDFAGYVYDDWAGRGGKDAAGVVVQWPYYVKKRWEREKTEWIRGTHKGKKKPPGGYNGAGGKTW